MSKLPVATRTLGVRFRKEDFDPHGKLTQAEWNAWVGAVWEQWEMGAYGAALGMFEVYAETKILPPKEG